MIGGFFFSIVLKWGSLSEQRLSDEAVEASQLSVDIVCGRKRTHVRVESSISRGPCPELGFAIGSDIDWGGQLRRLDLCRHNTRGCQHQNVPSFAPRKSY